VQNQVGVNEAHIAARAERREDIPASGDGATHLRDCAIKQLRESLLGWRGHRLRQPDVLVFNLGESASMDCNSIVQSLRDSRVPSIGLLCVRLGSAI